MTPIVVILLTFVRTEYALRTLRAALEHLRYPDLRWYIADDGSQLGHVTQLTDLLREYKVKVCGVHSESGTYGSNANRAWRAVDDVSPLTFWLEDDWELREPLDLMPYANFLMEQDAIGMVRLGYLNLGMIGLTIGHGGIVYWHLNRQSESAYVFTGHPSLRHRRMRLAYGDYGEGLKPGETELDYAWKFRNGSGPGIVYPAIIGQYGVFGHIGEQQSY